MKVGDDDPIYKGGSYLFVQKYTHDLNAFGELSTEEQEFPKQLPLIDRHGYIIFVCI